MATLLPDIDSAAELSYTLEDVKPPNINGDHFPWKYWEERQRDYRLALDYSTGQILQESEPGAESGQRQARWQSRLNQVRMAIDMHMFMTIGHIEKRGRHTLVQWQPLQEDRVGSDTDATLLQRIERENGLQWLLARQLRTMLIMGNAVWRLRVNREGVPRLQPVPPQTFYPVYASTDGRLREVIVVTAMTAAEASREFPAWRNQSRFAGRETVLYREYWQEDGSWQTSIGTDELQRGRLNPARMPFEVMANKLNDGAPDGPGQAVGQSIYALQDAVNDLLDSLSVYVDREARKAVLLADTEDLAANTSLYQELLQLSTRSGSEHQARILGYDISRLPAHALTFVQWLVQLSRESVHTPPIAYGQDEGSQRSGETLVTRLWSLLRASSMARMSAGVALERTMEMLMESRQVRSLPIWSETWIPIWQDHLERDESATVQRLTQLQGVAAASDKWIVNELDIPPHLQAEFLEEMNVKWKDLHYQRHLPTPTMSPGAPNASSRSTQTSSNRT